MWTRTVKMFWLRACAPWYVDARDLEGLSGRPAAADLQRLDCSNETTRGCAGDIELGRMPEESI